MLAPSPPAACSQPLVQALRQQVRNLERHACPADSQTCSTGIAAVDRLLAYGGLRRGTLCEWLADQDGSGSFTLAYGAARAAAHGGKHIVFSDRARRLYPAALAHGIEPAQLVLLRPASAADELWAVDQALRCPGVAAVWAELTQLREHDFRRLQLAAEAGGTIGLFCRSSRVRGRPTWSDAQFLVTPEPAHCHRRLKIEVLRMRGSAGGGLALLEIDDVTGEVREVDQHETHPLSTLSRLAAATVHSRPA